MKIDKNEIRAADKLIADLKNNKETLGDDQIYSHEEALNILDLMKKKKPRIKD